MSSPSNIRLPFFMDEIVRHLVYGSFSMGVFIGTSISTVLYCYFMWKNGKSYRRPELVDTAPEDAEQFERRNQIQAILIERMNRDISSLNHRLRKICKRCKQCEGTTKEEELQELEVERDSDQEILKLLE